MDTVRRILDGVTDPEIPVISIAELGILRGVDVAEDGHVTVSITPTYSGCPALDVIGDDVRAALRSHGYDDVEVQMVLAPAWTTDWMTGEGRRKLSDYGIAPPGPRHDGPVLLQLAVRCPQCGSPDTRRTARFGSTACKALYVCNDCTEPFDHFKAI